MGFPFAWLQLRGGSIAVYSVQYSFVTLQTYVTYSILEYMHRQLLAQRAAAAVQRQWRGNVGVAKLSGGGGGAAMAARRHATVMCLLSLLSIVFGVMEEVLEQAWS